MSDWSGGTKLSTSGMGDKPVDPDAELNNVQRIFAKLAPLCSIERRAKGCPQLAPQQKQFDILTREMDDTLLNIEMATKGSHAVHDMETKQGMSTALVELERLQSELRDGVSQMKELNILNYLSVKTKEEFAGTIPTENEELARISNAINRLKQIENRLEIATRRFCIVNTDNRQLRDDIHRLLVERNGFNLQWRRTLERLVKGKLYLMDLVEMANVAFADRDEAIRKLDVLKWQGHYSLQKDVIEMKHYESELNHLTKLEEFLRIKSSKRICEADEKERRRWEEEQERCRFEIKKYDELLNTIFEYAGIDNIKLITERFNLQEKNNYGIFKLLCHTLYEAEGTKVEVKRLRDVISDQLEINKSREERQADHLRQLGERLNKQLETTQEFRKLNNDWDYKIAKVCNDVTDLINYVGCDTSYMLALLGPHKIITKYNIVEFLRILEIELKNIIEIVYAQVAKVDSRRAGAKKQPKLVSDPKFDPLKVVPIEEVVPYNPCAYCVEDYVMNQVLETQAEVADADYIEQMLHLEEPNTTFGIYTLTIPEKRHPYKAAA